MSGQPVTSSRAIQQGVEERQEPQFATGDSRCSPWVLFAMPIAVGVLMALGVTIINTARAIDARAFYLGLDGLRPLIVGIAVAVVASVGLLFWLRPRVRTILCGLGIVLLLATVGSRLVRIESFYGNMVPRLAWAWSQTPEEQMAAFLVSVDRRAPALEDGLLRGRNESFPFDFPGFLGADRTGAITNVALDSDWQTRAPEQLWQHPVGLGWSSFAVVGNDAIVLEQRGERECVVCYDLLTGVEVWCHEDTARFHDEHGDGPRSTPAIDGDRVYTVGGTGVLNCLDRGTGTQVWSTHILEDAHAQNLLWGMSGSPLVVDGRVYVTPGGENGALICFNADDGTELWRAGEDPGGYASPGVAEIAGQKLILSFNGAGLRAFDDAGDSQWIIPWLTQGELQRVNVAQPIVLAGPTANSAQVLISSGYGNGTALFDVTFDGQEWQVAQRWHSIRLKSKMSNFVVRGDFIYGLDSGILTCIDLASGQRQWKRGRYGHGQMLLVGDQILVQCEDGSVALVHADPEAFTELGTFDALDGKTWNHLALGGRQGNILVVRNDHQAAAYRLPLVDGVAAVNQIH